MPSSGSVSNTQDLSRLQLGCTMVKACLNSLSSSGPVHLSLSEKHGQSFTPLSHPETSLCLEPLKKMCAWSTFSVDKTDKEVAIQAGLCPHREKEA